MATFEKAGEQAGRIFFGQRIGRFTPVSYALEIVIASALSLLALFLGRGTPMRITRLAVVTQSYSQ